jgi:hypothetical protein
LSAACGERLNTHAKELVRIATAARAALEEYVRTHTDLMFERFPRGTCGVVSELVGRYLMEAGFEQVMYVYGERADMGSHAWVEVGSTIVDITGDQFGRMPVVVTDDSRWHREWDQDEKPRPPICSSSNWPMYPFAAWEAMKDGIDASIKG